MSNEKIKQKIIEHICDGIDLSDSIHKQIESSKELREYYHEMKLIFNQEIDDQLPVPKDEYWEQCWDELEPKLTLEKTPIFRLFDNSLVRYSAVAIVFVVFGFLAGNFWNSQPVRNQNVVMENYELNSLLNKTRTLITSFVSMDEFSSYELLDPNIEVSKQLLKKTEALRIEYRDQAEIEDVLAEIERILIMISALKNKSAASVKITQFGIDNKAVISQINQIDI